MPSHHEYFLPVNWVDGMKINQSHFVAEANAFTSLLSKTAGGLLNESNYGLLPLQGNTKSGTKLFVAIDNQQHLQVRIQQCLAVTPGGHIVHFTEDTSIHSNGMHAAVPGLSVPFLELKGTTSEYLVVLTIDPYTRIPTGNASPAETPPRLPFTEPTYRLQLMPNQASLKNKLGDYQLVLGKLKVEENRITNIEEYIPPCACIASHAELLEIHAGLEQFLGRMELYSLQIIQKIFQKKQQNEMSVIVQRICEQVNFFTAVSLPSFKFPGIYQSPSHLLSTISAMARVFKNTLDMYIGSGKEELVNYLVEWCDVNQAELEGSITTLASHTYDHLAIHETIDKISGFTRVISQLFASLAKLEYIGKRKETNIFVKEQPVIAEPDPLVKKRRSFLAD